MMHLLYTTKKELKQNIGKELKYFETSIFDSEYKKNGTFVGCDVSRKFFAKVTMENDLIKKVA